MNRMSCALAAALAVGFAVYFLGLVRPELRQTVVMFPVTSVGTLVFLFVGSRLRPDSDGERAACAEFFRRLGRWGGDGGEANPKEVTA